MPGGARRPARLSSIPARVPLEESSEPMIAVVYIVLVVLFWAALFVFAFWTTVRFLRVPTEAEVELAAQEKEKTHA
jgi:hypothetical protein